MTVKELIDAPEYRDAQGRMTDAAYAAFGATCAATSTGWIRDDELDTLEVIWPGK